MSYRTFAASPGMRDQVAEMDTDGDLPREPLVTVFNYGYEEGTKVYHEGHIIRMPKKGQAFQVGKLKAQQLIGKSKGKLGLRPARNVDNMQFDETVEQRKARLKRELEELEALEQARAADEPADQLGEDGDSGTVDGSSHPDTDGKTNGVKKSRRGRPRKNT